MVHTLINGIVPVPEATSTVPMVGQLSTGMGFAVTTIDTKDYGRILLGGGFAGVDSPAHPPLLKRRR